MLLVDYHTRTGLFNMNRGHIVESDQHNDMGVTW